jgi:starch-binding outer membrane protein, SusD/RagB family
MKIIKIFLIAVTLSSITLTGCSDNFLEENPKDAAFADNIYTDLKGFTLAKNALLDFPRQERQEKIQSAELAIIWKIGTDVAWANSELSWTKGLNQYTSVDLAPTMQFLNGDTSGNPGIFLILYRAISSANVLISRAENPNVDWGGSTVAEAEKNKNEMIAHAKLIRAYAYRHLAMTFGAVPISTKELTGANYRDDWERAPVAEVQNLIEEDLLFAEKWLPDNSKDITRLSKAIAQHYLAELYLWKNMPDKAEEKARAVVTNPNYKLITQRYGVKSTLTGSPFMDQFYSGNILPKQGNTEALWIFPNSEVINLLGRYNNCVRRTWVSAYNNVNVAYSPDYGGRGIGRAGMTPWVFTLYEPQDDRGTDIAIRKSYITRTGSTINTQFLAANMTTNNNIWRSTRKWDWTYADPSLWGESYSYADQTYIRLADTYLLLAEALFKQGKNNAVDGAAFYINAVRTRSKATPITAGDVTLDYILDERARELVTEENRRETLVRTGKLVERTRKYNPVAAGTRNGVPGIQEYQVLLPIPQKVIDANVGKKMEQNPGYN